MGSTAIVLPAADLQTDVTVATSTMEGPFSGTQAEIDRLPFNAKLRAYNVHEIPVDPSLIDAAGAFYFQHMAPRVSEQRGSFRSGQLAFYVTRPRTGEATSAGGPRMMRRPIATSKANSF